MALYNPNQKPVTMRFTISGGIDGVIPKGIIEHLVINIWDNYASYHFTDAKITRAFYIKQKQAGDDAVYVERLQKCLIRHAKGTPEDSEPQEQLAKKISESIKKRMGAKNG